MADRFVMTHLKRLPMFAALPEDALARLADFVRVLRLERGETVFQQWQVSQGLVMFISGQGVLVQQRPDGSQIQLGTVGPSQFLNEAALTHEPVESATLYITHTAIVLFLSRHAYRRYLSGAGTTSPISPAAQPGSAAPSGHPQGPQPAAAPVQRPATQVQPAVAPQRNHYAPSQAAAQFQPVDDRPSPTPSTTPAARSQAERIAVSEVARTFVGQRPNETVILMTRRHWIAWVRQSLLAMLLAALLLFSATIVPTGPLASLLVIFTLVVPVGMIAYIYVNWRDDWLIVTNQRVVHIEQVRIRFSTRVSEIALKSVQSINADLPNNDPLAYYFKYGTVEINTAGTSGNILMDFIPDPDNIKDIVFQSREQMTSLESQTQRRDQLRAVLDAQFGEGTTARASAQEQTVAAPNPAQTAVRPGLLSTHFINDAGEMVFRKHLLFWLRKILAPALLVVTALGVILFGLLNLQGVGGFALFGGFFLLLIGAIWLYYADWDWRNDLYIIGDATITLIRKRPFFAQDEDDQLTLDRVDNIQTERSGILRRLFNFGDVRIQLLGDTKQHVFKNVPNPQTVREEISRRQAAREQRVKEADIRRQREEVVEAIRLYHENYGAAPPPSAAQPTSPPSPTTVGPRFRRGR
jgi:hypothetical protein